MPFTDDKGIGIKGWISGQKPTPKKQQVKDAPEVLDKHRIAVLPFSNISPDNKDEYFADGMTEELISTLSTISGLRVIARTSVMRYKTTNKGVGEIGQELKVGTILEGSIRKILSRIRATVQLIDVSTEEHLWAQSFDRDVRDVFAIQSDIARKIAEALRVKLVKGEDSRIRKTPTSSIKAHTLYLRGRAFWNERTEEGLKESIGYFRRAIEADPGYAVAHAGLSDAYTILLNYGFLKSIDTLPIAKTSAMRALELDEQLAEGHASLGMVFINEWDIDNSLRELERAIDLNPSYASAHHWYSMSLAIKGQFEDSMREIMRAADLDPLSPIIRVGIGCRYLWSRQFERAILEFRSALGIFPDNWGPHAFLGFSLIRTGRFDKGISELNLALPLSGNDHRVMVMLAVGYALAGKGADAKIILGKLTELSKMQYIPPALVAYVHAALGNRDEAFDWLEKAYQERYGSLAENLAIDPLWSDLLGSDPRFSAFLQKLVPSQRP